MTAAVIHDLKARVREIQLGVALLPLGAVTPELLAAVQDTNRKLAELLGLNKPVRVTCRKPTAADIALHQAKQRLGSVPAGIEPTFSRGYLRRSPRTE